MDRVKRKQLCTRCHNVVVMVRAVRIKSDAGHRLARVDETSDKLRNSNCGFCKLIATIKSPLVDDKPCELRAYSANRTFARVRRPVIQTHNNFTDTVVLGIVPTRGRSFHPYDFIGVLEPRQMSSSCMVGPRKIKPDQINFDLLRSWLSFCGARHGSHCKSSNANEVRSLKVIDCITEKVIKAPENCRYVALSYVWGSDASSLIRDQTTHQRLETFSPVVRDSITVVKELGYQYLWVDKNVVYIITTRSGYRC